ncbi:MAG: DNA repair exonuclease [Candidatus Aenigmarchaeota archaeon]|nr:DNA repair exonuclease [Candidatus Aenigmarchaeota archaeon]
MKIAVLSDLHFGYAYNSELENDSFDNAEEAIDKALGSDLILVCGDVFDIRGPKTTTWAKALKILSKPLLKENPGTKLVSCTKELKEISRKTLSHVPVIAIHGNHERLTVGEQNTVEALENAGILIRLHLNTIIFEKDGIKVAVHGMSSVPERYAKDILYQWNPQPVKDCFNILVFHQNIEPFIYSPIEPPTISISNLPRGFDIVIDGHIHTHTMEQLGNTKFIIPGSTVITQFQRSESEVEKTITQIIVGKDANVEFVPLETARKFFYEEMNLDGLSLHDLVEKKVNDILFSKTFYKKPVIRIKLNGTQMLNDRELNSIVSKYANKAVIVFVKDIETPEMVESVELLRNLKEQKLSIEEIGLSLFRKNLDKMKFESGFDYQDIFTLLSEGETETVFNILSGEQKSLVHFGK